MFPNSMIRTGVRLKPWIILCADFDKPGYIIVNCKTREVVSRIEESNQDNKECLKIEKLPFFDDSALPFVMTLTATGLNLVNTKLRKSYLFKAGKFKDFCFQSYGQYMNPVC